MGKLFFAGSLPILTKLFLAGSIKGQTMLERQLQKHFGFTSFLKGQKEVIAAIVDGQSAAAIFPTGAGKSLCYQLPAVLLPGMTLVISPLLSLMKDQLDFLLGHNIDAARLDSTLTREEYNNILHRAETGKLKILMISAERFKNERFRMHLQRMNTSLLVIDEAHCISEWGHNFRPEYLKLPIYRKQFRIKQVLLLTATATKLVIDDMCRKLDVAPTNVTITGFYRENLFLQVSPVAECEKDQKLLSRINETPQAATIVYVTLQKTAERVAQLLASNGINARAYHAGMKKEERETVQAQFMSGSIVCIVATIAFGMGIDKNDIRRIIHYDLPKTIENYSQEIGRSGRDGKPSFCEVMANQDNIHILENFIYGDTPEYDAIYRLFCEIKPLSVWEVKMSMLSNRVNVRVLPLKTLLVYLDVEGIIQPKYSYFEEYSFKYIRSAEEIAGYFQGERKQFVTTIFRHCHLRKIWAVVDIEAITKHYGAERKRIVAALDYFEEKGWIELQPKQAIEVYAILNQNFSIEALAEKIYRLFKNKEAHEIQRIHDMIAFLAGDHCISKRLAEYFSDDIAKAQCNHCSFCQSGKATIAEATPLTPLSDCNFEELADDFITAIGERSSPLNLTKFLCGIYTPIFTKYKIKKMQHFGTLEKYRFADVKNWVEEHIGAQRVPAY